MPEKKSFYIETQHTRGIELPVSNKGIEKLVILTSQIANQRIDLPLGITIRVVDNQEGLLLNEKFAKKKKATNVLSFLGNPSEERELGINPPYLGDIIICLPIVEIEAKNLGKSIVDHFHHMVVHGFLHLIGFDHQNDEEESIMINIENKILTSELVKEMK